MILLNTIENLKPNLVLIYDDKVIKNEIENIISSGLAVNANIRKNRVNV